MDNAKQSIEKEYPSTKVLTYSASITDHARVSEIINEIGTIDVLVANAGVMHTTAAVLDVDPDEALESFKVNVLGPLNLIRGFVQLAPRSKETKRTVIYTSTAGIGFVARPGSAVYSASKSAMTYIMRCVDAEYREAGIRAFAFHPAIASALRTLISYITC
jgi:NAD(P)-dependent dehydrogenase (short-subunit alcohol dehydrogenase family)